MREIVSADMCFGCGVCAHSCPKKAISMILNNEGFLTPVIDETLCVNCGICKNTCGSLKSTEMKNPVGQAFGAAILDDAIKKESTSGGFFSAIAKVVLNQNGCVFGAASLQNCIKHIKVETEEGLTSLRGSKYVQSNIMLILNDLHCMVNSGRLVLFSGTPCQCSSVKSYLLNKKCDLSNVFFVDLVCHGVCSPLIFNDYIDFYNRRNESKVVEHRFRVKNKGWANHTEENILQNGKKDSTSYDSQVFKSIFYSHFALRNSCYLCRFTSVERVADITMADFWGLKDSKPEYYDPEGVSFVLVNSVQGKRLFDLARDQLSVFDAQINDTAQPSLYEPCKKPVKRDEFWNLYYKKGFDAVAKKYFHTGKMRRFVVDNIRRFINR